MPLVRIDLLGGRTGGEIQAIADAAHRALVETLNVPARDRFQIITEHPVERFILNQRHDWSFGKGEASYVVLPKERWR